MNKTLVILRHEFNRTLRRTGFIILTLAVPVLSLLGIGIYQILSGVTAPPAEQVKIGYVDETGSFNSFTEQNNILLIGFGNTNEAKQALLQDSVSYYFVIPSDYVTSGEISLFTKRQELAPQQQTLTAINDFLTGNLLSGGVPDNVISRVESGPYISTTMLTSTGEVAPNQGGYANFIVPAIFSFLLGISLIFSSTYVLQSLAEEKENRLMEVLLSSVSTRQLLAGKVLGLGAAGLVQVLVWVISLPLLLNLASASIGGIIASLHVPLSFWVLGVTYFILGYAMFAVLSASIAAVSSTVQEAQGLAAFYSIFNFAPFWALSALLMFPANPVWIIFSIFPFSAPVLTMMRLGLIGVPAWQLALSIIVLILSIAGGILLAARLLRAYMLMYGKRPGIRQIIRNLGG